MHTKKGAMMLIMENYTKWLFTLQHPCQNKPTKPSALFAADSHSSTVVVAMNRYAYNMLNRSY